MHVMHTRSYLIGDISRQCECVYIHKLIQAPKPFVMHIQSNTQTLQGDTLAFMNQLSNSLPAAGDVVTAAANC